MKSAPRGMSYRRGLINGASKEYGNRHKEDIGREISSLIMVAGIGLFLIISGIFLLRILG